jgi:primosomal protein N' (replication factor Y)
VIAQIVFDLPLEGVFDYLIPPSLENRVHPGMRVEVTLGFRKCAGLVTTVLAQSAFDNLKSIRKLIDQQPLLDQAQLALGISLSNYYGCSLGDALFAMARACDKDVIGEPLSKKTASTVTLYLSPSGQYHPTLISLIQPLADKRQKVLILVADQYTALATAEFVKKSSLSDYCVIGMRSSVFRSLAEIALVIMMDEDNSSFKQEQTPMYETRDVLLMRSAQEKVDVAFVSTTPTVELMHLVEKGRIHLKEDPVAFSVRPQVVDLNNYKIMIKGLLSPAVLTRLESNIVKKLKTILVFNHRGSYAMTRCTECSFVLKCERCDSAMLYSRTKKQYLCRYCSFYLPGDMACPKCNKPSWKSFGLGVEQLQKTLQDKFPLARINSFERGSDTLKDSDILIGTWALLRFKNQIRASMVAFLDIDSELNRLDMRSCFRAWSMVEHLRGMARDQLLVQSRQVDHYVLKALAEDRRDVFYQNDIKIRRELGFSPFAHQISIHLRGKEQKAVEKIAQELYQAVTKIKNQDVQVHAPSTDVIVNKRGQYRLNILLQGPEVVAMISLIKQALASVKRRNKVIVSINVDA